MSKQLPSILLLVVFVAGCSVCSSSTRSPQLSGDPSSRSDQPGSEDYEVYSVLLDQLYIRHGARSIVIAGTTSVDSLNPQAIKEGLALIEKERSDVATQDVIDDFVTKNLQPYLLKCNFKFSTQCVLLSKEEVSTIGQTEDGWTVFFKKYSGQSLINLSRVGFNKSKNIALVYSSSQRGGRTGRGQYVFLTKVGDAWVITQKVAAWVS